MYGADRMHGVADHMNGLIQVTLVLMSASARTSPHQGELRDYNMRMSGERRPASARTCGCMCDVYTCITMVTADALPVRPACPVTSSFSKPVHHWRAADGPQVTSHLPPGPRMPLRPVSSGPDTRVCVWSGGVFGRPCSDAAHVSIHNHHL